MRPGRGEAAPLPLASLRLDRFDSRGADFPFVRHVCVAGVEERALVDE